MLGEGSVEECVGEEEGGPLHQERLDIKQN
jgi:hypothetical protein